MMSDEPVIVFDHVSKMYHKRAGTGTVLSLIPGLRRRRSDEFWALKDVSFEVKRGECLGIIGPNGAGKSTVLKILSRVTPATSGSVRVNGRLASLIEVGAGFHPELTGRENVYLNAAILGMTKKEIDARFDEIVDFAELWDFIDVPVKRYSSGMYVRLGFAVAAHLETEVLLVDEVLAVGDIAFRQKCLQDMQTRLQGLTKVIISHDMAIISMMCERVLVLGGGRVRFEGRPSDAVAYNIRQAHLEAETPGASASAGEVVSRPHRLEAEEEWVEVPPDRSGGRGDFRFEKVSVSAHGPTGIVEPGQEVTVRMRLSARAASERLIIGYFLRDRNGIIVFGDNTLSSGVGPVRIDGAGVHEAAFRIVWPSVAPGEYTLTLGVGEGDTQDSQIIQDWAQNVVVLRAANRASVGSVFNNPFAAFSVSRGQGSEETGS